MSAGIAPPVSTAPYPLDEKAAANLEKMFFRPTGTEGQQPVRAILIDCGTFLPYVGVLRQASGHWCDWLLFRGAARDGTSDDSPLWFRTERDFGPLSQVEKSDAAADGSCKWDGCREVNVNVHECDSGGMAATLRAVAFIADEAARVAGYEGDEG